MAITKAPFIRYKILDDCFRNPYKSYHIDDLLDAINSRLFELTGSQEGIKIRQLRDDIAFMKSEKGWSIQLADLKIGKKAVLRYEDQDFSIFNLPLNEIEMDRFKGALEVLAQFEGMPQFEGVPEMIAKLKISLPDVSDNKPFIGFETNQDLKGVEYFSALYHATQNKQTINITYRDFNSVEAYSFVFHPYYMKQYNSRWFIFGLNTSTYKEDCNLAIDRIISIESSSTSFIPSDIDWQDYFSDMIGVSKPEDSVIEEVILHFNKGTGRYMENKPLHETQKHRWLGEETLEIRIRVIVNYELERLILSYADSVKVLSPHLLKQRIRERVALSAKKYSDII